VLIRRAVFGVGVEILSTDALGLVNNRSRKIPSIIDTFQVVRETAPDSQKPGSFLKRTKL